MTILSDSWMSDYTPSTPEVQNTLLHVFKNFRLLSRLAGRLDDVSPDRIEWKVKRLISRGDLNGEFHLQIEKFYLIIKKEEEKQAGMVRRMMTGGEMGIMVRRRL